MIVVATLLSNVVVLVAMLLSNVVVLVAMLLSDVVVLVASNVLLATCSISVCCTVVTFFVKPVNTTVMKETLK